jgi:2-iminobutanoate/2-iminopropanoate deaminase
VTTPRRWSPADVAPPVGRYSHLAAAPADSELIFVSGQVGAGADAYAQTREALLGIAALLDTLGEGPHTLIKLLTFVAGPEHLAGFYRARDVLFDEWFPDGDVPAHSLAVVAALAKPHLLVEIEGVAVRGKGGRA